MQSRTMSKLRVNVWRGAHFREDYPEPGNLEQSAFTRIRLQGDAYSTQFVPVEFSHVAPGESLIEPEPA